jgi:hypothetical protein
VLGNVSATKYIDVLTRAPDDPEPLVCEHLAWGITQAVPLDDYPDDGFHKLASSSTVARAERPTPISVADAKPVQSP